MFNFLKLLDHLIYQEASPSIHLILKSNNDNFNHVFMLRVNTFLLFIILVDFFYKTCIDPVTIL